MVTMKKVIFEPVIAARSINVLSLAPALLVITGFRAFFMLEPKVPNCPDTWLAIPCAALAIVP